MPEREFPVAFHFKVAFGAGDDEQDNRFQDVGGFSAEVTLEEHHEGGLNTYTHRLPTGMRFGNLVLKRGYIGSTKVAQWCRDAVQNFAFSLKDIDVSLLNEEHQTLAQWTFTGAYPVKWSLSELKAQENALAIESLELAYRSFRKV